MNDALSEAMIAELRQMATAIDPVPDGVRAAANTAFALRTLDDELAALTHDSWAEGRALSGVRGATARRMLTFEAEAEVLSIEVDPVAANPVMGQLLPGVRLLSMRTETDVIDLDVDELGRFELADLPKSPVSFRWLPASGDQSVATDWVVL